VSGRRVLVIEDNPLNIELLTDLLEGMGCVVVPAPTGEAGLSAALAAPPDLALVDLRLPRLSGLEVLHLMREQPTLRGVPVIAVTAEAMQGDEARTLRAGFDGYLSKPVDASRLRELVRDYLFVDPTQ
jgi:CheY-like chemotaxis protein